MVGPGEWTWPWPRSIVDLMAPPATVSFSRQRKGLSGDGRVQGVLGRGRRHGACEGVGMVVVWTAVERRRPGHRCGLWRGKSDFNQDGESNG